MNISVGLVAICYPKPEYQDEMIRRVRSAAEVIAAIPGCLNVGCCQDAKSGAIMTTGERESNEARTAAFGAVAAATVDFDYDYRESRPRDVFNLKPA